MNSYEKLLSDAYDNNIYIDEDSDLPKDIKGLYVKNQANDLILINKCLSSTNEKYCILAEELGHYHTTYGNIHDQDVIQNKKLEKIARNWGYERLVSIDLLIKAFKERVTGRHDLAEYLGVTEKFLMDAVDYYKGKHGVYIKKDNYIINFDPLGILEIWE